MDNTPKLHYHLVSGQVLCHPVDQPELLGPVTLNAVIVTQTRNIPAVQLTRSQGALQQQLFTRHKPEEVTVLDVVISTINYLGEMTPAEFLAGSQKPETAKADPTVN